MPGKSHKIIVIVGPTASGKSDIANLLASKINGEVVSADSMQIYKGMDIGTGKITQEEQSVKHWGLDIVNPNELFSAALFQEYSRSCFEDISNRDKSIVLCGGTGFYVRASIDDYKFPKGEQENNPKRKEYEDIAKKHGNHKLWSMLNKLDPESASIIHENNVVRVVRALELHDEGLSYSEQVEKLQSIQQVYDAIFFGLKVDPDILRKRIDKRVDKMIDYGLIEEVKDLLNKGYREAITAANAIGYKEIVQYLDKEISLDKAIQKIKTASKQYAKRQRTWFNKDKRVKWIDYDDINIDKAVNEIISCCDKVQ